MIHFYTFDIFCFQIESMSLTTVGWGSLVLAAGLSARVIGAFAAVSGGRWGQALKYVKV